MNPYYWELIEEVFMWLASLTYTKRQGIVTHHQFLMDQAGHTQIMRKPTATPKFVFQNSDQREPVKSLYDQKDVIFTGKTGEKELLVVNAQKFSPESLFQKLSVVALLHICNTVHYSFHCRL